MASESLSSSSLPNPKSSKALPLGSYNPFFSNNPELEYVPVNNVCARSVSPNGYQLYKKCVEEIHQLGQPAGVQTQATIKYSSESGRLRGNGGERMDGSVCSIEDKLEEGKSPLPLSEQQQLLNYTIRLYEHRIQQLSNQYQTKISDLTDRLIYLQQAIDKKQQQLQEIRQYYQKRIETERVSNLETKFHPVLENRVQYNLMKETLDGLSKQCRDIERKIRAIVEHKSREWDQGVMSRVEKGVERVEKEVVVGYGDMVQGLKGKVDSMLDKYGLVIGQLERKVEGLEMGKGGKRIDSELDKNTSFVGINVKIVEIKQKLVSSQLELRSIPDLFRMYNTQYQQLFAELKKTIEKESSPPQPQIHQEQEQRHDSERMINSIVTPISLKAESYINSPKHQIKPISMFKSMFYSSCSNRGSRELLSSRNLSDISRLQKLIETFNVLGHKLPQRCSIDETGYLKYKDSGTYIFDQDGNLFELNREELEAARDIKLLILE